LPSAQQAAFTALINSIQSQLTSTMTVEQVYALIYGQFKTFFNANPTFQSSCSALPVKGKCNLGRFLDVSKRHFELQSFKTNFFTVNSGQVYPAFWYAMNTSLYANYPSKFNSTIAQYIFNALSALKTHTYTTNYNIEIQFIVSKFYALFQFYPSIEITILQNLQIGTFGSLWDFFDCSSWTSPKLDQVTTVAPSTEATSTDASSAAASTVSDGSSTTSDGGSFDVIFELFIKFTFGQFDLLHYMSLLLSYFDGANDATAKAAWQLLITEIEAILNGLLSHREMCIEIGQMFFGFCHKFPHYKVYLFGQPCCFGYTWEQLLIFINELCGGCLFPSSSSSTAGLSSSTTAGCN